MIDGMKIKMCGDDIGIDIIGRMLDRSKRIDALSDRQYTIHFEEPSPWSLSDSASRVRADTAQRWHFSNTKEVI